MSMTGSGSKDSNNKDNHRNSKNLSNSPAIKNNNAQNAKEEDNGITPVRISAERLLIKRINLYNQIARTMLLRGGAENLVR